MTDNVTRLPTPPGPPGGGIPQPRDIDAERQVLGAMLLSPRAATTIAESALSGHDFWTSAHEDIYDAIASRVYTGQPIDPTLIADDLGKNLQRAGGLPYLHELIDTAGTDLLAEHHAAIVRARSDERRAINAAANLIHHIDQRDDTPLDQLIEAARDQLAQVPAGNNHGPIPGETIDHFLAGDTDDEYDWLIEGFLERQDRLILTAGEGAGKSTLLRQWAIHAACGINPATLTPCTPARVLLVDLENSRRQSRRKFRTLHAAAGARLDPKNLIVHCKIDGLDLRDPADRTWLDRIVEHHKPDILISGPLYKMSSGDPNAEVDTKPAAMFLDKLREAHDIAIILEAHIKKGEGIKGDASDATDETSDRGRAKEPFGWSGWMRWPEFGIHLARNGAITHWRGLRDERTFPHQLNRGGEWPFMPAVSLTDQRVADIKAAIRNAGHRLSERELSDATGIPRSTLQRVLRDNRAEFTAEGLWGELN